MSGGGLRQARPEDDHFFRVEVTVAACIATPDNRALGDNMGDVTLGFSMSAVRPPEGMSDRRVNAAIAHNISPILALIQATLTSVGYAFLGTIDPPMTARASPTGEFGHSTPVRVTMQMPKES